MACSDPGGSARPTGRTTCPSARRRGWPATPCASCTSTPAPSTSPTETGDTELLDAVHRRWRDMVAHAVLPHGRARQPARATRRSATRTSCRPTARTRRRARRSPASCSPGACSSRRATPTAPTSSSGRSTTACCPGVSLDGTRFFYVNPLQRRTHRRSRPTRATASARRWYACACCPPNLDADLLELWPQYLATTDDARRPGPPVRDGRDPRRDPCGGRAARGRDRLPVGRSGRGDDRRGPRRARGRSSLRIPAWARPATRRLGGRRASRRAVAAGADRGDRAVAAAWRGRRRGRARPRHAGPPHRAATRASTRSGAASPIERGPLVYCIESADLPDRASSSRTLRSDRALARSRCRDRTSRPASSACRCRRVRRARPRDARRAPCPTTRGRNGRRGDARLDPRDDRVGGGPGRRRDARTLAEGTAVAVLARVSRAAARSTRGR